MFENYYSRELYNSLVGRAEKIGYNVSVKIERGLDGMRVVGLSPSIYNSDTGDSHDATFTHRPEDSVLRWLGKNISKLEEEQELSC